MPLAGGKEPTGKDKARWEEAKAAARKKGLKGDRFWAYANSIYQTRAGRKSWADDLEAHHRFKYGEPGVTRIRFYVRRGIH